MRKETVVCYFLLLMGMFLFVNIGCSAEAVYIEFLYYEPCSECPGMEDYYYVYLHNSAVVLNIEIDYGEKVIVERIKFYSKEGTQKIEQYNLTRGDWNTIIVNREVIFLGGDKYVNETYLREVIDFYLSQTYIHDIAITDVTLTPSTAFIGEQVDINITVKNEGNYTESFNVTICIDSNPIKSFSAADLEPNQQITLGFRWNVTEMPEGNYTLSAQAYSGQDEIDNTNNFYFTSLEVKNPFTSPSTNSDIAIINIIPEKSVVYLGEKINLTIYVKNNGTEVESFVLKTYFNESLMENKTLVLTPNEIQTVHLTWDTHNVSGGIYIFKAIVEPVENEVNLLNNEYICLVKVRIPPPSTSPTDSRVSLTFVGILMWAFSLGFFETFSPCLVIMLSFILGYTLGDKIRFKDGFVKVMIFGIGFVFASAVLGIAFGVIFLFMPNFQHIIMLSVCVFAILFGLNLLGLLKFSLQTKPILNKLTNKYVFRSVGIFLLGFIFYFLDPCIAPIFVSMTSILFEDILPLVLVIFCIGALIPFFGIGIFAGSVSKLSRKVYKHRFVMRGLSGAILIGYALYLMFYSVFVQL
ncbi:MAG: hypothetical protein KIH09_16910 [Candidatus Freyarchaeota archaeon]|nr:hypothetical protein [Candidatus Jordarchaeia archaeon]